MNSRRTRVLVIARTRNFVNDNATQHCVRHEKKRYYPFRITGIKCYVAGLVEE